MINTYTDEQAQVLLRAANALQEFDKLKAALKAQEAHLSDVSREYANVYKLWGVRPEHLRQACVARGLMT
jgi:hypothetical protein